jgi:AcrR family transcriptional regulator
MRKRPRQLRSRVTVTSILEAADRILRVDGYDAASTNRLARVAGFSVGSLYQYFPDKQGIVGALIDRELVAEAEALAALFDRCTTNALATFDAALAILFERRVAHAHIYRALDEHGPELGAPLCLAHLVAAQAPIVSDALQRTAAQLLPRSARGVDARVYTLARVASQAAFAHAVDVPTGLAAEDVRGALVAAAGRYLEETAPSPDAIALVGAWSKSAPSHASAADLRGRRRRESRAALLAAGIEPRALEPRAFALGCLAEVTAAAARPPFGVTSDELLREAARFVEALRSA